MTARGIATSRITVLGGLNTDLVISLPRFPRPGETLVGERLQTFSGGKGANQAVAAARLGARVAMVGRVGADAFGDALMAGLIREGVDASGVARDPEHPTGTALIFVDAGGENMIAVAPGANQKVGDGEVARALGGLKPEGVLVLQLEVPMRAIAASVAGARARGARVLLNASPAQPLPAEILDGLDALVVNEAEAAALFGPLSPEAAAQAAHARGVRLAIVTLGAAGTVFCDGSAPGRVPPVPVTPVDTTAAGDAFVGALAVALAAGQPAVQAVRLANAAGAAATTRAGAQSSLPRWRDLERLGL